MSDHTSEKETNSLKSSEPDVKTQNDVLAEFTVIRKGDELVIRDSKTGQSAVLKTDNDLEDQDQEFDSHVKPLTADEFCSAIKLLDSMGLTWTADRPPRVKTKDKNSDDILFSEEFQNLQRHYPGLPRELDAVVLHILTGTQPPSAIVGSGEELQQKIDVVREYVITAEYRSEFFFKYAIKVPYLVDIDWEIVFKLLERNVKQVPGISYALLSLSFINPNVFGRTSNKHQSVTVAMNDYLVDRLISILTDVKKGLEHSRRLTEIINKQPVLEAEQDATINTKQ